MFFKTVRAVFYIIVVSHLSRACPTNIVGETLNLLITVDNGICYLILSKASRTIIMYSIGPYSNMSELNLHFSLSASEAVIVRSFILHRLDSSSLDFSGENLICGAIMCADHFLNSVCFRPQKVVLYDDIYFMRPSGRSTRLYTYNFLILFYKLDCRDVASDLN